MFSCLLMLAVFIYLAYVFFKLDANPILAFYERFFPNQDKLKNKTVWIVGASTGIGEALAREFAKLNCRLILTSTTESKLNTVAKECIKESNDNLKPEDILVLPYDISDFKKNNEAFQTIIDKFGDIDLLVNNAGRVYINKIEEDSFENHRKLFDINYFANIYIAEMVTRHWLKNKSKDKLIMPTSSIGAYCEVPFAAPYLSSKRALNHAYRELQTQVYDQGSIKICIICPGPTSTSLGENSLKTKHQTTTPTIKFPLMATKRVAELAIVAAANRLSEAWICEQPHLIFTYLMLHFSHQLLYLMNVLNFKKYMQKYSSIE